MRDFSTVLADAQDLPEPDRLRLIDALWSGMAVTPDLAFADEWKCEIERRIAELDAGTAHTTPWSQVRDEALARIAN